MFFFCFGFGAWPHQSHPRGLSSFAGHPSERRGAVGETGGFGVGVASGKGGFKDVKRLIIVSRSPFFLLLP